MTPPIPEPPRWAWAEVDLRAIAHNVGVVREVVRPAAVWAVVKADGYGHGATEVARAALAAGAEGLAVALVAEGVALRRAGIDAPILILSEQPPESAALIVEHALVPTVATTSGVDALAAAAARGATGPLGVHLKIDTGMHRVGASISDAPALAARVGDAASLLLAGVFTHLAVADELSNSETARQLGRLDDALADLPAVAMVHAANSAGGLAHPASRRSFVRVGIAMYGISPGADVDELTRPLRPALALKARVSFVKRMRAGDRLSYGLRHMLGADANVATVPLGYADGVRRNLSGLGTEVLIGEARHQIVGTITMDQFMVDCGDHAISIGDEVVLIGRQGDDQIRAEHWASALGTIGYEIVCGIGARVPRRYIRAEDPTGVMERASIERTGQAADPVAAPVADE